MHYTNGPLAAVLPTSVLLGTDVVAGKPKYQTYSCSVCGANTYVVRTRGQTRQEEAEDAMKKKREPKWWRRQLKRNWLVVNSMTICLKRINPT